MASSSLAFQPRSIYQRPEEDVLLSYEAEEERIPNVLYQKLERLREEKQGTQNDRERDQHIDRLTRQIARLESQPMLLEAMRAENAQLRTRVTDLERDFLRVSRVNEIYRQELLEHRRRLGLPYESLIGLGSSASGSISSSPVETRRLVPATSAVPIPRVQSQTRMHLESAPDSTPPSSPSYSLSPTQPFFPSTGSQFTTLTTPSSAPPPPQQPLNGVLSLNGALNELATQRSNLTYPSVPPPSLASSLGSGSPVVGTVNMAMRAPPNSRRQSRGDGSAPRPIAPLSNVSRRRAGSAIEDELEEIDEAYSDEEVLEDDEDELGRRFVGLEIGRRIGGVELGDGVGRGPLDIRSSRGGGLGLSGPR
ncbi:unnamed protein product [Rhizoctonia solani]|uniref:Uncharacterized protein n=1 Tax=Rhizoctonia solani TaxID=456999 RepID=A0A8H7H6X0_9AGAM|nr:uncharacterized protein RhiXN_08666 [Rhizoctonia solani]KAF8676572.1 hypothetical protein RHS04_06461 [Rhizoctonia solani]QRW23630.1 hypothetical protein RhiXN_08666 [Rhizoctonia solani]CAE6357962.1 unnamed protein product [Rhizoctonia solani]